MSLKQVTTEPFVLRSVCCEDPPHVDREIYNMWVSGVSMKDAWSDICKTRILAFDKSGCDKKYLARVVSDQYSIFESFFHCLCNPILWGRFHLHFSKAQVDALIEAFYHLDESVKGEFLGMQMSKGLRGDIQEIADRAGVPALSCRRQFENLMRISKELVRHDSRSDDREREERWGKKYKGFGRDGEGWETIGDFSTFLEKRYRLSRELASEYISFAFVSSHKVECKKKGVQALAAIDILHLSDLIMLYWGSAGSLKIDESLCDSCRVMSELLKRRKPKLVQLLQTFIDSDSDFSHLSKHLKELGNIVKNALGLVKELNASRSLQDILVNIVQTLLLPILRMQLSLSEVPSFLLEVCGWYSSIFASSEGDVVLSEEVDSVGLFTRDCTLSELVSAWERCFQGARYMLLYLLANDGITHHHEICDLLK